MTKQSQDCDFINCSAANNNMRKFVQILSLLVYATYIATATAANVMAAPQTYDFNQLTDDATVINSQVRQGQLLISEIDAPGTSKVFALNLTENDTYLNGKLTLDLVLPLSEAPEKFSPQLAVVTPLTVFSENDVASEKNAFTFNNILISTRSNVKVTKENLAPTTEFIPQLQTSVYKVATLEIQVTLPNKYYIIVNDDDLQSGKFMLAVNGGYSFASLGELATFKLSRIEPANFSFVEILPALIMIIGASIGLGTFAFLKSMTALGLTLSSKSKSLNLNKLDNLAMITASLFVLIGSILGVIFVPAWQHYQVFMVITSILMIINIIGWQLEESGKYSKYTYFAIEVVSFIVHFTILTSLILVK